ncbi:helix-turn-helix domain-containing protein, partial [Paenibacillus larvae]
RAMNMAPFIFWNLAFYTIIRTQLIFHQRYVDTNTFASKNYVSYPTMNRRIKQLKPLLNKFKLLYLSKPRATFVGSEKQFRYFFYLFYWNSYWGMEWPFPMVKKEDYKYLLKDIEKIINQKLSISEQEMFLCWLAISISRIKLGALIDEMELYRQISENNWLYPIFKDMLIPVLKDVGNLNERELENEVLFLFSVLNAFAYYSKADERLS